MIIMTVQNCEVNMMGTKIQLTVEHQQADIILEQVISNLKKYEKRFSAHDPQSELMQVNQNAGIAPVKVNPNLYQLIKIGKEHSCAPDSSLNITIGPLMKAWHIGFDDAVVPASQKIQSLLKKTQPTDIILDDDAETVFLKYTNMFIDLGALAKGFIADLVINSFTKMNVTSGLINLGGNVMTYGNSPAHDDGFWRIGIEHPFLSRGNYIAVLKAFNQSVVTSGIYERKLTINNKTYHHILNRHTGYPIETNVVSLTIVSKQSVDGEIWTGRLFGKSPVEVMHTLNQLDGISGIVITNNGELHYSEELEPYLVKL